MNDGDWICSDANCGNINFARRLTCYRCNKEKPDTGKASKKKLGTEIGKSAAEKSRGLFNADDWQCNKCANVNWARRTSCNVCNAPKFGEVEARTGYGGGYNERGVVEYRRRESSSSDEFDEFGRRKRKRKSETQKDTSHEKVGTTEGPVNKMLPPMLYKETKMEQLKDSASDLRPCEKVSGSLSDGSVCDYAPLSRQSFRKYQIQNQTNYYRQDHMLPNYKSNNFLNRRRYSSIGDKDCTGSSGYETGSKRDKRDSTESPIAKAFDPVMENRVSSTNNDVVYKFTGPNPAETFEISYSLEERVRVAAMAICYNNLKVSSRKFESLFDKPAPDFKTIFAWRQRLLTTGCLVDSHVETMKDVKGNSHPFLPEKNTSSTESRPKSVKLPNPEEISISISSESDEDNSKHENKLQPLSRHKSVSVETLVISGADNNPQAGGSIASTADDQTSQARTHSRSTQHRDRSSSSDSRKSDYPDTDSDQKHSKSNSDKSNLKSNTSVRQSMKDSDSDSISYDSDEDDFLSRVYKGKKQKRKTKKRSTPVTPIKTPYETTKETIQGYSTLKHSDISPLATGNIYAPSNRNMAVKNKENPLTDLDACSVEYVPTKIGSNAQRNYQTFKDNVKKKGFWAKANGQSMTNKQKTTDNVGPVIQSTNVGSFWSKQYSSNKQSIFMIPGTQGTSTVQSSHQFDSMMPQNKVGSYWSRPSKPCKNNTSNTKSISTDLTTLDKQKAVKPHVWTSYNNEGTENTQKYYTASTVNSTVALSCPNNTEKSFVDKQKVDTNICGISDVRESNNFWANINDEPVKRTLPEIIEPLRKRKLPVEVIQNADEDLRNRATELVIPMQLSNKAELLPQEKTPTNCWTEVEEPSKKRKRKKNYIGSPGLEEPKKDKKKKPISEPVVNSVLDTFTNHSYETTVATHASLLGYNNDEFTKDDLSNFPTADPYKSFDNTPEQTVKKSPENTSCIFDMVQSNNVSLNKSILDIFDTNVKNTESSEPNNDLDKYDHIRKKYETEWDDDDDALYGTDTTKNPSPPPSSFNPNKDQFEGQSTSTPNTSTMDNIKEKRDKLIDILNDFKATREFDISNIPMPPAKISPAPTQQTSLINKPLDIPAHISNEIIGLSEEIPIPSEPPVSKTISPSKKVHIIESITIKPNDNVYITPNETDMQLEEPKAPLLQTSIQKQDNQNEVELNSLNNSAQPVVAPQIDLSNILSNINTNTLLMALQNLQQISQTSQNSQMISNASDSDKDVEKNEDTDAKQDPVETINLTNDEDWEKESLEDCSIEKQLARLDGNTGDTPFLGDIFDPGPVTMPPHLVKKLNINLKNREEKAETHPSNINENAPVIGNFKSFALPKPILLNRLKVTMKVPDKPPNKKTTRKDKSSGAKNEEEEEEDEESGDEADLSKYDLIGSDEEQGTSKPDVEKSKDGEDYKDESAAQDKNGKHESPDKSRKRRSSSSSSTSSSSSSSSSQTSEHPKNRFDDFNLNSEREGSPRARRSRSPHARPVPPARRKSRDSRSGGESRNSRDKDYSRDRDHRDKSRDKSREKTRSDRKERRYSRDATHYSGRNRHR